MMKSKLFDYVEKDNIIYNLTGFTKFICFILLSASVMFSYDIRFIIGVGMISFIILRVADIRLKRIRMMLIYVSVFIILNFVLTFIFSPRYGETLYGSFHPIFSFSEHYTLSYEQLLYQLTKSAKYASAIPIGILFFLATNPSEFAASLNKAGLSYKAAYPVSLTLRYFPEMIRNYNDIALAQQSRGLDLSKKEKFMTRVKNTVNICFPLILVTLDRIEIVTNAMDLRGFGKSRRRTWYSAKPMATRDWIAIILCFLVLSTSILLSVFINHSRFWNPFS